ncbi:MAG: hypothetical protein M0Z38_07015 [Deltaproteobacteria bacterium]|nr:hypothetical protein [Deltaproteobacteria bacterium]
MKIDTKRIETVDDAVAAALREMGPARRLEMVFHAEKFTRMLMEAGARSRHPEWSDEEIHKEVARLWLHGSA